MPLFKQKFRTSFSWNDFSKERLWSSAILGFTIAIIFYAFLSVGFEFVRYGTFSFTYNDSVIMDPLIRRKMNLFMAGLAVLLGNSIGLVYLFRRTSNQRNRRRDSQIINNQAFVLPSFIYVCFKSGFMAGALLLVALDTELRNLFFSMVCLLGFVFYLESVKALSLFLGRKRYKILSVHFVILLFFTVGLSYVSFVDSSKMEKLYLSKHPYVSLPEIDLSYSQKEFSIIRRHDEIRFKILYEEDTIVMLYGDRKFGLKELPAIIYDCDYYNRHRARRIQAYVTKNIPMSEVKKFELRLSVANRRSVNYVVDDPNSQKGFVDYGILKRLPFTKEIYETQLRDAELGGLNTPPPFEQWHEELLSKEVVSIAVSDMYKAYGQDSEGYFKYIASNIREDVVFNFVFDHTIRFEEYLTVFALSQRAIYELRNRERQIKKPDFGYEFQRVKENRSSSWNKEDQTLKKKYPMRFLDNYNFK